MEHFFLNIYFLFSRKTNESYIDANLHQAENLVSNLNIEKPMVVYIHGFTESVNSSSVQTIVNGKFIKLLK